MLSYLGGKSEENRKQEIEVKGLIRQQIWQLQGAAILMI
jgi:hypothetical protein